MYLGDGDVKVGVEGEDGTGNKDNKDRKGSVLKVRQLDLHRPELDTPSNWASLGGWGLEPHRLPVGALQVLKVIRALVVVNVQQLVEDDQGVTDKEMRDVASQQIVDSIVSQLFVNVLVKDQGYIVVLGLVGWIV